MTASIRIILQQDRLFSFLQGKFLIASRIDIVLLNQLLDYINAYVQYYSLSASDVIASYTRFITRYDKDVNNFNNNDKYPYMLNSPPAMLTRLEYDIALMLSTVLTPHRFRIMQLLHQKATAASTALIVGYGSGLEIELVKKRFKELVAYDLSIGDFWKARHKDVSFAEGQFTGTDEKSYDKILLIELSEHLEDPYWVID